MKSFIFVFLLIQLCIPTAQATRARLQSLMGSRHLIDEQHLYYNPLLLNHMNSQLSFESGQTAAGSTATTTSNAEAFISYRQNDEQIYALSVGHQDEKIVESRKFINDVGSYTFEMNQNPVQLFWARKQDDTYFAASISYAHSEDKLSQDEESVASMSFGVEAGAWQYFIKYIPVNDVISGPSRFDGAGFVEGNVHFISDGVQGYVTYSTSPLRGFTSSTEAEAHLLQTLRMGIVDARQLDGENTFWSVDLVSVSIECQKLGGLACRKTPSAVMVPVVFGFESTANSWLTLRSSIKQNFIFDQQKDDVGYPAGSGGFATGAPSEFVSGPNSTQVAFGAGLNFDRLRVDAVILASGSQVLNSTNLLSQVGLVYSY